MHPSAHPRELLIGVIRDPVFGPAITFGAGGTQVEILRDRAIALPPLNAFLAEKMIDSTRIARLLGAYRGMPAIDMDSLIQVLQRVSEMEGEILSSNHHMLDLVRSLGFTLQDSPDDASVRIANRVL